MGAPLVANRSAVLLFHAAVPRLSLPTSSNRSAVLLFHAAVLAFALLHSSSFSSGSEYLPGASRRVLNSVFFWLKHHQFSLLKHNPARHHHHDARLGHSQFPVACFCRQLRIAPARSSRRDATRHPSSHSSSHSGPRAPHQTSRRSSGSTPPPSSAGSNRVKNDISVVRRPSPVFLSLNYDADAIPHLHPHRVQHCPTVQHSPGVRLHPSLQRAFQQPRLNLRSGYDGSHGPAPALSPQPMRNLRCAAPQRHPAGAHPQWRTDRPAPSSSHLSPHVLP